MLCITRQDPNTEEAFNQILLTGLNILHRGCTDPERQVYRTTRFFTASLNNYGSSVEKLFQTPRILRWLLEFWNISAPLYYLTL